jgi:hypothetical protein
MDVAFAVARIRTVLLVAGLLTVSAALWAGVAQAASSVSVTVGADPVESITTQLGLSGSVTGPQQYVVEHYKPAGGAGCGANPSADDGTNVSLDDSYLPAG